MSNLAKDIVVVSVFAIELTFGASRSLAETNQPPPKTTITVTQATMKPGVLVARGIRVEGNKETNGWSCVLSIGNVPKYSSETPPVCGVSIANILPTNAICWGGAYGVSYSGIELFDSSGKPIQKTEKGKEIGTRLTDQEIKEMVQKRYQDLNQGRSRTDGFIPVRPGENCAFTFSLPDLFEIHEPGEYILKIQTCLIQRAGGNKYNPDLKIIRPPEVVAKIPLR